MLFLKMKRILVLAAVAAALFNFLTSVWSMERLYSLVEVFSPPVLLRKISNVNTSAPPSTSLYGDDNEEADEDKPEIVKSAWIDIELYNFSRIARWSATSRVRIDKNREFVWKQMNKFMKFNPLEREVCILEFLSNYSWAPRLLWYNSSGLVTNYVGAALTTLTIPLDYKEQMDEIIVDMESVGINHGDIHKACHHPKCKRRNISKSEEQYDIMVLDGRLSLIDFGWATKYGNYSCKENISSKCPRNYRPSDDRSIFPKLDDTFRRHLLVEQHFLVDWTLHYTEYQIREKIKKFWPNLSIQKMVQHPMYIRKKDKVEVLSKFYRQIVDDLRGETSFNMYFIYDHNPKYDFRPTSKGQRIVNTAMLDLKRALRNEMGGGFKIHATDNIQETKENMKALGMPEEYDQRQFDTLGQIFDVLNFSGLEYVVLRNFEKMPDEIKVDPSHLDVDLLVSDYYHAKRLLDGINPYKMWETSYENGFYRIVNSVMIDGKLVNFDVRYTGDNYLDRQWQLDILKRRIKLRGMFVPSKVDHLHSLIYHAIIQKPKISETYVKEFKELGNYTGTQARDKKILRERLDTFMDGRGYKMMKPNDKTVGYFSTNS